MSGKPHEYDRSKRLSERKHETFLQLNDKDFKNLSGDHQRTNIWEVRKTSKSSDQCHNHKYIQLWELRN